jgi:hypothetical protein
VAHKISQFETTAVSISCMYNNNICCSLTSTKRLVAYWGGKNIPKKCDRNLKNDKNILSYLTSVNKDTKQIFI